MEKAASVDDYLAAVPEDARGALEKLRKTIKASIPGVAEVISYGMPIFKYKGKSVVGIAAFKNHCSFFPMSLAVMKAHEEGLKSYDVSKGTIRFPASKPLTATLVTKLVKARIAEIETSATKKKVSAKVD